MTIEYLPVGIACNLSCSYCYQDPMRDAGNINVPRNWERVQKHLTSEFTVFGGEPLLAPIEHLEEVWAFGLEKYGKNSVQTNGTLITDRHIELFHKYRVGVGISVDGPGSLNSLRDSIEGTNRVHEAIRRLCEEGLIPSLIVTLHRENTGDRFLELVTWLGRVEMLGVKHVNFHILEREKGRERLALTEQENIQTFLGLYLWSKSSNMTVEPFDDIKRLLTERNPHVSCIWNHCDPATTAAVHGVSPDGTLSNCGRTNKDGVNWVKADTPGFERYLLLRQTPQDVGGCAGCEYFIFCKGQCPGTAIDGDWRNRTVDCRLWYALFERIEADQKGKVLSVETKKEMENNYVSMWSGEQSHGDSPHSDSPHGDSHGDSLHGDVHVDSTQTYEGGIPGVFLNEPPKLHTT
jgi:uncharacterized protein